jgi:hypothetical protein
MKEGWPKGADERINQFRQKTSVAKAMLFIWTRAWRLTPNHHPLPQHSLQGKG